ncbi:MAG: hypothetical protein HY547_03055 [Elusimicrobia bacterium]|nr:hypothetical protein [Elusimicrobiota bacterium]
MKLKKKRCAVCRHWFAPDPRVAHREFLYCPEAACRQQGQEDAQARWLDKNPDYYKGEVRKAKVRRWAEDYPSYWHNWRQDHEDYRRREARRLRLKRLGRVAKQDQIRQNPLGYLEGIRLRDAKTVAKQDQMGRSIEGILDFLTVKERVAKQEMIEPGVLTGA